MLPSFASLEFIPIKLVLRNSGLISTWLISGVRLNVHPSCQKPGARGVSFLPEASPFPFPNHLYKVGVLSHTSLLRAVGSADPRATTAGLLQQLRVGSGTPQREEPLGSGHESLKRLPKSLDFSLDFFFSLFPESTGKLSHHI